MKRCLFAIVLLWLTICAQAAEMGENHSSVSAVGAKRSLVILVNFQDVQWQHDSLRVWRQLNEVGYSEDGHIGSVRDYFREQSYGKFDVTFDVVGPVSLAGTRAYYGAASGGRNDVRVGEMVREACTLANGRGADFSQYDWDNDGEAEMVTVLFAGYGQDEGHDTNMIWPQQWSLTEEGSGKWGTTCKVNKYLVLNELTGDNGNRLEGIGKFVHEYSHGLGLPDIYDSTGKTFGACYGMSEFSVMDHGYMNNRAIPCNYTAYERAYLGWLNLKELTADTVVTDMEAISRGSAEAYLIRNDGYPDEYLILYAVEKTRFDSLLPAEGLVIMHVDFSAGHWRSNTVNTDPSHPRCTLIPADGQKSSINLASDLWPYGGNDSLVDSWYNANTDGTLLMHKSVANIVRADGKIGFVYNHWRQTETEALPATDVMQQSFTANWLPTEEAVSYELEVTTAYAYDRPDPSAQCRLEVTTPQLFGSYYYYESPVLSIQSGHATICYKTSGTNSLYVVLADRYSGVGYEATVPATDSILWLDVPAGQYYLRIADSGFGAFALESVTLYDEHYESSDLSDDSEGGSSVRELKSTIAGITDEYYAVSDTTTNTPLYWYYRIRALLPDGTYSQWSEKVRVEYGSVATGCSDHKNDLIPQKILQGGRLQIIYKDNIYNINGVTEKCVWEK